MNRYEYVQRMREPSTYAGLGILLAMVGVELDSETLSAIGQVGAAIAALFAIFLAENRE
jgi:hypothetical protein